MMVDPNEAAEQLAYVRRLSERTRLRIANAGPALIVWGAAWAAGYIGTAFEQYWAWSSLAAAPFVQFVLYRRRPPPPSVPPDVARILNTFGVAMGGAGLVAVAFIWPTGDPNLIGAYWPVGVGVAYITLGVHTGRVFVAIGGWLVAIGLAALAIPHPIDSFILAAGAGGAMILTGALIERFLRLPIEPGD